MPRSIFRARCPTVALLGLLVVSPAQAQQFLGFGGIEGRLGVVSPEDATVGFGANLGADFGYLGTPWLRTVGGLDLFTAGVDRAVSGDLSGVGAYFGLRFDIYNESRVIPYLGVGLIGQSVSAEVPEDLAVENLLEGFYVGTTLGGGIAYAMDEEAPRAWVTGEVRRTIMNNVGRWSLELGLRYTPRGREMYASPPPEPLDG